MSSDRLSGLDSSFLHLERGPAHMHVASTTVFEGPTPVYDELCEHIESRLHLVPRFRQKLRMVPYGQGRPKWVDDPQFNLRYHIRHTALPPPGSEEQLLTLAARVFSQRLDRSKPLWEMWLVDKVDDGRFALVTKTHHALVDGVSGVDITNVLFDAAPDPETAPETEPWTPHPEPSDAQMLAEALIERATSPAEIGRGARAVLRGPRRVARAALDAAEAAGTFARAGVAAPELAVQHRDRPLPAVRGRPRRPRGDQARSRTPPAAPSTTSSSRPSPAPSGATCASTGTPPISSSCGRWCRSASAARASTGRSATASPPTWRRCRSGATTRLVRLRLVNETMGDLKQSKQAVGATLMTELADFAPPTIAAQAARLQSRQRFFNLVVTNIPGPQFPLYLLGRELEAIFPMVPLAKRQAVCFGIMSYNGQVNFGITADYDGLTDLETLARDLQSSLAELAELAPASEAPRRSARKAAPAKASRA